MTQTIFNIGLENIKIKFLRFIKISGKEPTNDADDFLLAKKTLLLDRDISYTCKKPGMTRKHSAAHITFSIVSKAASINSLFSTTLR